MKSINTKYLPLISFSHVHSVLCFLWYNFILTIFYPHHASSSKEIPFELISLSLDLIRNIAVNYIGLIYLCIRLYMSGLKGLHFLFLLSSVLLIDLTCVLASSLSLIAISWACLV